MSDDAMFAIIKRTTEDEEFRQRLVSDLEGTLKAEGYKLTSEEMDAAREFHGQYAGMDDKALQGELGKHTAGVV